jgi:hypothetical protein
MSACAERAALIAAVLAIAMPRPAAGASGPAPADEVDDTPADEDTPADVADDDEPDDGEPAEDADDPEATEEAEPTPPAPGRSVWATDEPAEGDGKATPGTTRAGEDETDARGRPIGGYLDPNATKEIPPHDGEKKLIVAYILLPLGTLATVTGALSTWATEPEHCQERLGKLASRISEDDCPGLYKLNIVRTTYGSLMVVTGAVLLGLGLRDRKRHREWVGRHGARLSPWIGPRGAGLGMSLRF